MKKYLWMSSAAVVTGPLRVNLHVIFRTFKKWEQRFKEEFDFYPNKTSEFICFLKSTKTNLHGKSVW